MNISDEAKITAYEVFTGTLLGLRLKEGGGFKVASQQRRAILAALEAAASYLMADAWDAGWTHARGNYLALSQGQEVPDWVTLRNPYRSAGAGE